MSSGIGMRQISFVMRSGLPKPNSPLESKVQVPLLDCSLVTFDGSLRKETCSKSRNVLELASLCKFGRAIDVVGHGCV